MFINIIGVKTSLTVVCPRGGQGGRIGAPYPSTTPEQFKAPTTGLGTVLFMTGTNEDAANFIETKKRLARYVGTCSYRGAAKASLVIETMTKPTFMTVSRPVQPILKKEEGGKIDDSKKEILLLNLRLPSLSMTRKKQEWRSQIRRRMGPRYGT